MSDAGESISLVDLAEQRAVRPMVPAYVTEADGPWLAALLEERERFVGKPRRLWRGRLCEPLKVDAPPSKLRAALRVLDRLARDRPCFSVAPRTVRAQLFRAAVAGSTRGHVLAQISRELGLDSERLLDVLFADLPGERLLVPLPGNLDSLQLALMCNEQIVIGLLQRALRLRIEARGQTRAVVRQAKWMGLVCVFGPDTSEARTIIEVSGPYALFRHTRLYGRALAALVERLARCDSYRVEADCVQPGKREIARLLLKSGDPLPPARELSTFDSQVEARFAKDFAKVALEWDVIREPAAIPAGALMCFPDFLLRHRTTGEQYWLEIIGFWTPEYLRKKVMQLRAAGISQLILCVAAECKGARGELEALGPVIAFRRRIDPLSVLSLVEPGRERATVTREPRERENTSASARDHRSSCHRDTRERTARGAKRKA